MINPEYLFNLLLKQGISFFTGVPDSLLKDFCACVEDNTDSENHVITANEGGAIGLAAGYYLAKEKAALVYMQNSGFGNSINPLLSLADPDVYSIPMLLIIGWRGEPGVKDEPQHVKQGKVQIKLLETLEIPYKIVSNSTENIKEILEQICCIMREHSRPCALVVKKGTFSEYKLLKDTKSNYYLNREEAIKIIVDSLSEYDIIVSTTGKTSRELFEYREKLDQGHSRDFLTVGSMGHASQIALAITLSRPTRKVYCLDGDGALIMHMGSLAIIGSKSPKNFKHIVLNNGAHDSVGGQPTAGLKIDIPSVAKACGYITVLSAEKGLELKDKLNLLKSSDGPALLEIKVNKGARKDLGRPKPSPLENKKEFMRFLLEV